jgi:hypothetical protein
MIVSTASTVLSALGATPDPSQIGPGLPGFLVMFGLAVALLLLVRSMAKHLRKVRYSVLPADDQPAPPTSRGEGPTVS